MQPGPTAPTARERGAQVAPARRRPDHRWLAPLALVAGSIALAAVFYLIRPGAVTDDTYAFLDWGRDLLHGYLPLLEQRTFQPVPILAGSVLSLFGTTAAPTVAIVLSLAALALLAAGAWRLAELLTGDRVAAATAAILIVASPLLLVLALVGYNNLPFATLVVWAVVLDVEGRRTAPWVLLLIAGVMRPEAWAFLVAYAVLVWWRAGRPRRGLPVVLFAAAPIVIWVALEAALFGDPLYSLHTTAGGPVQHTGSNGPGPLWRSLDASTTTPVLIAAAVGALATARLAPARRAFPPLAATGLAALSVLILAGAKFNIPTRHMSLVVALLLTLAAVGAVAPARALARRRGVSRLAVAAAALAGAVLVVGMTVFEGAGALRWDWKTVRLSHDAGRSLAQVIARTRPLIDTHGAGRHTVAMVGAPDDGELAWTLGVPFNVVTDRLEPGARLMVEPSAARWARMKHVHQTDRFRVRPPRGWRLLARGEWEVYAPPGRVPVSLRRAAR